jgi:hypothetical protein
MNQINNNGVNATARVETPNLGVSTMQSQRIINKNIKTFKFISI